MTGSEEAICIIHVEPFEELLRMRRPIDRLLEDVFPKRPMRGLAIPQWEWEPPVEMFETENEVIVRAALSNIDPQHG